MFEKFPNRLQSIAFVMVLLIPRQLGLLGLSSNIRTRQMSRSQIWLFYSIACGFTFSITYPMAIHSILSNNKELSECMTHFVIEVVNHITMYLFSMAIYLRSVISIENHMKYNNLAFKTLDKCAKLCTDKRENAFILPFVIRVICSYLGYITLNVVTLTQIAENLRTLPILYIAIYFIPDLIMTSTMIRVGTAISMQILSCQRVNQSFFECMNLVNKSFKKSPVEQMKMGFRALHRFNRISEHHIKVCDLTRKTKDLTSSLVISSILKAFVHISSLVSMNH